MNVHMKNTINKYKLNFKTMKKGLLTLLAASLFFVGCQNYDDQFDDLNAQISALKSQVDGLASLSSQVSSISGSISGLQAGIAAAQSAAAAAGTEAANATVAATAAGAAATAAANEAAAAAVAAGETASAAAAAAEAAAVQAGATAAEAITAANAAAAAATAAGADAVAAAEAAADEAVAAAVQAGTDATDAAALATAAAEAATAAAIEAGADAVAAANAASAAAVAAATEAATEAAAATAAATTAGTDATAAANAAAAAAVAAGETASAAAAAAEAAAVEAGATATEAIAAANAATTAATAAGTAATAAADAATAAAVAAGADAVAAAEAAEAAAVAAGAEATAATAAAGVNATTLAALAAEVDSLAADLAAVQASLATVSTAEEVAALQVEIDAIEADLEELMLSSNVYQGGVTVNSATSLDAVYALGNSINIVNGDVSITNLSTYDQTKVQAIINRMVTVNGSYTFVDIADATDENTASPSFNTLASAGDIIMTEMNGAVSFAALVTAGEITITGDSYDHDGDEAATTAAVQAITSFSAPLMSAVDAININDTDGIDLSTVGTLININSVTAFADTPTQLDITFTSGGTLTASALTTPLVGGDETFIIRLAGLSSYTAPAGVKGGTLTVSETPTLVVDDYQGTIDIDTGVTSFTGTSVSNVDLAGADELQIASINYVAEGSTNAAYVATEDNDIGEGLASLSIDSTQSDLNSLTVSGNLNDVTISGSSVASVTITATMDVLTIDTSDDLTSVTLTGASIGDIIIDDNDDLASLTIDNSSNLAYTGSTTANTGLQLDITNNDDLETLTVSGDVFDDIDVDNNAVLATIDFSGVTAIGAAADVSITGNNLKAVSITETDASEVEGTINAGTSGMGTLGDLFTALTAQLAAVATVQFDSVETLTEEAGEVNNGNDVNLGDADDDLLTIYVKAAGSTGGTTNEGTQTTAVGVVAASADDLIFAINGVDVNFGSMSGVIATDLATVQASAGIDAALAAGAIVTAKRGYNSTASVSLTTLTAGATGLAGERYTTTAAVTAASTDTGDVYGLGNNDAFTLTVGDDSVTATFANDDVAVASIVDAWDDNWPADSVVTLSQTGDLTFDINAVSSILDSSSYNLAVSITVTDSTTASTQTSAALEYTIGSTRATNDNSTVDQGFIMQFTSTAAGATNNTIVTLASGTGMGATIDILTAGESPEDGETGVDGVVTASATGVSTDLTSWISG